MEHVSTLCAITDKGASQCQYETNGSCSLAMLITVIWQTVFHTNCRNVHDLSPYQL